MVALLSSSSSLPESILCKCLPKLWSPWGFFWFLKPSLLLWCYYRRKTLTNQIIIRFGYNSVSDSKLGIRAICWPSWSHGLLSWCILSLCIYLLESSPLSGNGKLLWAELSTGVWRVLIIGMVMVVLSCILVSQWKWTVLLMNLCQRLPVAVGSVNDIQEVRLCMTSFFSDVFVNKIFIFK